MSINLNLFKFLMSYKTNIILKPEFSCMREKTVNPLQFQAKISVIMLIYSAIAQRHKIKDNTLC